MTNCPECDAGITVPEDAVERCERATGTTVRGTTHMALDISFTLAGFAHVGTQSSQWKFAPVLNKRQYDDGGRDWKVWHCSFKVASGGCC